MEDKSLLTNSANEIFVQLLQANLQSAGIPSWTINKKDSSYMTFGEIEVYVNTGNLEAAQTILKAASKDFTN